MTDPNASDHVENHPFRRSQAVPCLTSNENGQSPNRTAPIRHSDGLGVVEVLRPRTRQRGIIRTHDATTGSSGPAGDGKSRARRRVVQPGIRSGLAGCESAARRAAAGRCIGCSSATPAVSACTGRPPGWNVLSSSSTGAAVRRPEARPVSLLSLPLCQTLAIY